MRIFVSEHEREPDKAEALRAVMHGFHGEMLTAVAVEATNAGSAVVPDANARRAVKPACDELITAGQLVARPQPTVILDALVDQHVLVRVPAAASVSFLHQQFQEFYAAAHAEALMRATAGGSAPLMRRVISGC